MNEFNDLLDYLGKRIRDLRKEKGFSQEEFAFQCNLDRTYISDIELGKRNVSIINLSNIADALGVPLFKLFMGFPSNASSSSNQDEVSYKIKPNFSISCGFNVTSLGIFDAVKMTSNQLQELPFAIFQSIDLKALSGMVGAIFSSHLAKRVGAIINPIEKGHPDIIPTSGKNAREEQLRNYPEGLEIKCTVGNVEKGSNLTVGERRLPKLSNLTWQAHHKEVKTLLGLVIDFSGKIIEENRYPVITAVFYSDNLEVNDWGQISGTTGRNTKVTGMTTSGKYKMGKGWVVVIDQDEYKKRYGRILSFSVEDNTD
jgi:DNA-binding XRE family transcriptional regulator